MPFEIDTLMLLSFIGWLACMAFTIGLIAYGIKRLRASAKARSDKAFSRNLHLIELAQSKARFYSRSEDDDEELANMMSENLERSYASCIAHLRDAIMAKQIGKPANPDSPASKIAIGLMAEAIALEKAHWHLKHDG